MRKLVFISSMLITFVLAAFFSYRIYLYERDEALRNAVSMLKEGEFDEGFRLVEKLAKSGNKKANNLMGRLYAFGLGVEMNREKAEEIFSCKQYMDCVAGKQEYAIGLDFINGYGGVVNYHEGRYWIDLSSSLGYEPAMKWLKEHAEH